MIAMMVGSGWVSTPRAQIFASLMGLTWAAAIGSMAYAVSVLGVPVSQGRPRAFLRLAGIPGHLEHSVVTLLINRTQPWIHR